MAEYIDRVKLLEHRKNLVCTALAHGCLNDGADDAETWESAVKSAPIVDVAPVVHGRWIDANEHGWGKVVCSICGKFAPKDPLLGWETVHTKFCPNCGAKMDLGV